MNVEHSLRRDVAATVAREAGRLLTDYAAQQALGAKLDVTTKTSLTDPVSNADRASERHITTALHQAFPADGIITEEGQGETPSTSGYWWVIDPLDGTVNFLYGVPLWCVSIACVDSAGTVAAAIYHPAANELFTAVRDGGALLNGTPLAGAADVALRESLIATGFSYEAQAREPQGHELADLLPHVRDIRRGGAAALDLAWVACGRYTAYFEMTLKTWDWAAGALIVTEAGGVVRSFLRHVAGSDRQLVIAGPAGVNDILCEWQRRHATLRPVELATLITTHIAGKGPQDE